MNYRDWGSPITLETPLPAPPKASEKKRRFRTEFLDSDDESDDQEGEPPATRARPTPAVSASLSSPPSTTPLTPPSSQKSKESEVSAILPILAVPPNQRMSLQSLFPLLQDTFLGMLNHVVTIQNQSRDSIFRALGKDPPAPFPTFEHPYRSTPTSPRTRQVHFSEPPVVSSTPITPEMLAASLSAAAVQTTSTTEPYVGVVKELVGNIPSSSRLPNDSESEDEVIILEHDGSVSAQPATSEPEPTSTTEPETTTPTEPPQPETASSPSHPPST